MPLNYSPLKHKLSEIRLVIIAPGSYDDELRCSLRTVSLHSKPKYEALSYMWGDPTITTNVIVDSISHPVTVNLECALRNLRHESKPREMWIDALCINQTDINEKNHQIPLMAAVYRGASEVVISLGSFDESMSHYASWAHVFERKWTKFCSKRHIKMSLRSWISIQGKVDKSISELKCIHGMYNVWYHPYFRRMWTFQEFVLAKRDPVFLVGQDTMRIKAQDISPRGMYTSMIGSAFSVLRKYAEPSVYNMWNKRMKNDLTKMVAASDKYLSITNTQNYRIFKGDDAKYSLPLLLAFTSGRVCFDIRDKIFGFYALIDEQHGDFYKPDYNKPIEQVFLETIAYIVQFYPEHIFWFMNIIPLRKSRLEDSLYPSWLPDLASDMILVTRPPKADRMAPWHVPLGISEDLRTLEVVAYEIGKSITIFRFEKEAIEIIPTINRMIASSLEDSPQRFEWIRLKNRLPQRIAYACHFHDLRGKELYEIKDLIILYVKTLLLIGCGDFYKIDWEGEIFLKMVRDSASRLSDKVFFRTQAGLFGICDSPLEDGDMILKSPSFLMPMAVRRCPQNSEGGTESFSCLIGWAFVDGIVGDSRDEEVMTEIQGKELERIFLR